MSCRDQALIEVRYGTDDRSLDECTGSENSVTSLFAARRPVCLQQPQPNKHCDRHQILETDAEHKELVWGKKRLFVFFSYHHHHRQRFHGQYFTFGHLMLMNIMPWSTFLFCLFSHFLNVQNCFSQRATCYQHTVSFHSLRTVCSLPEGCVMALFWWKRFWPGAGHEGLRCVRVAEMTSVKAQLQL